MAPPPGAKTGDSGHLLDRKAKMCCMPVLEHLIWSMYRGVWSSFVKVDTLEIDMGVQRGIQFFSFRITLTKFVLFEDTKVKLG